MGYKVKLQKIKIHHLAGCHSAGRRSAECHGAEYIYCKLKLKWFFMQKFAYYFLISENSMQQPIIIGTLGERES
jgi:hypothetical protein